MSSGGRFFFLFAARKRSFHRQCRGARVPVDAPPRARDDRGRRARVRSRRRARRARQRARRRVLSPFTLKKLKKRLSFNALSTCASKAPTNRRSFDESRVFAWTRASGSPPPRGAKGGLRESNPRPPRPKRGIMPLDQVPFQTRAYRPFRLGEPGSDRFVSR